MSPRFALSAWDGVRNEIERQKSSLQLRKQYVLAFGEHALKDERFVKFGYFEEFIRASAAPRVFCENDVAQNIFKVSGMLVQAYPSVANLDIVLSTADILNESVNFRVRCEGVKFLSIIAAGSPGLIGADLTRKLTRLYDHVWEVRFSLASVDVRETCVGLNFIFAVAEREKRLAAEAGEKEAPRFLGRLRKKKAPVEVSGTEIYQREIEKALARFEPAYPFPAATPICRREHRGGNGNAYESRIYCDDGWVDVRGTAEKPTVEERIAQREKVAPSDVNGLVIEDTVEEFVSWAEEQRLRVVFIRKAPSGSAPSIPAAPRGPQPA
ncbi:MAG: hypothetical protein PHE27_05090, partial [Alphaproteobacteria bacterium]|nr:hypothetical protein [Alphaproteobacteria bacterium]